LSQAPKARSVRRIVFKNEVLILLRDRRALFAGLVLPVLLYPLVFLGQGWLTRFAEESTESREVLLALELSAAPEAQRTRILALLEQRVPVRLRQLEPGATAAIWDLSQVDTRASRARERALVRELCPDPEEALVSAGPDPDAPRGVLLRIFFDATHEGSREAAKRASLALGECQAEVHAARLEELLGGDPAAALVHESRDLALAEDLGGALLGRMLPLFAVLVLLSAGSYAALSAFAGEREAGTIETLLVQPVPGSDVVWGKAGAVLLTGLTALGLNLASLLAAISLGLGNFPGSAEAGGHVGPERFFYGALMLLPLCLLISAVLCLVCGRARSFREGQHYLLPLSLLTMLPAALAMMDEVELDPLLAAVPIAGSALAFRDVMVGNLALFPGLVAWVATLLWSALALSSLGTIFDAERVLVSEGSEEEDAQRRVQSRKAIAWGFAGVLSVYVLGGLAQGAHAVWGLALTLWLLLPLLSLLALRGTLRRAGEGWKSALFWHLPRSSHLLAALLAAPALARLSQAWIAWQEQVLPLPSSLVEADFGVLGELSGPAAFALLALSPGICEELFFRGAILSGLRRDLSPQKCIAWQALLFGAVHASIYRFVPSALLGGLLAALTLRSRSLLPAMLLHTSYNGVLILGSESPWFAADWVPWLLVPAALLLFVPARARA